MKRILFVVLSCTVALVGLPSAALATPVDDAVAALKNSPVYVAPGTPDTDADTAGVLTRRLKSGDNLVMVMLPTNTESGDISVVVSKINQATGGKQIIGLSVGDQVVAYSSVLPAGVAKELMDRAVSVSSNNSETLGTFISNIHAWQRQHPQAPASQPTKEDTGNDAGKLTLAIILGTLLAMVLIFAAAYYFTGSSTDEKEQIKFRSPDPVRDRLKDLLELRNQVLDPSLQETIYQLCSDVEALFQRRSRDSREDDAQKLLNPLERAHKVLVRYIDAQNNHRYFTDYRQVLADGAKSINGFAIYVITSIQRDSTLSLIDYHVDTKNLDAKRHG